MVVLVDYIILYMVNDILANLIGNCYKIQIIAFRGSCIFIDKVTGRFKWNTHYFFFALVFVSLDGIYQCVSSKKKSKINNQPFKQLPWILTIQSSAIQSKVFLMYKKKSNRIWLGDFVMLIELFPMKFRLFLFICVLYHKSHRTTVDYCHIRGIHYLLDTRICH